MDKPDTSGEHFARAGMRGSKRIEKDDGWTLLRRIPPELLDDDMSYEGQDRRTGPADRRVAGWFDPTINLSTIIGAGALLVSGALAYATLDKRISVLETQTVATVNLAAERAGDTKESLKEIKADIKELTRSLEEQQRRGK